MRLKMQQEPRFMQQCDKNTGRRAPSDILRSFYLLTTTALRIYLHNVAAEVPVVSWFYEFGSISVYT